MLCTMPAEGTARPGKDSFIGVLDIYGFETFKVRLRPHVSCVHALWAWVWSEVRGGGHDANACVRRGFF